MPEGQEIERRWTLHGTGLQPWRGPDWHDMRIPLEVVALSDHQAALERAEAEACEIEYALQAESDDNFEDLEKAEARAQELETTLAKCYRATGSEPSGVDSIDAAHALQAVEETRKEAEESWDQEHARAQAAEAERDRAIEYAEAFRAEKRAAEQALEGMRGKLEVEITHRRDVSRRNASMIHLTFADILQAILDSLPALDAALTTGDPDGN